MEKIKGILFDKDGVLVDFEKTWVNVLFDLAKFLSNLDSALEARLLSSAGFDAKKNTFTSGSIWAAGNTNDLVTVWEEYCTDYSREQLILQINTRCMNVTPVALFGMEQLQLLFSWCKKQDLVLGVATNDLESSAVNSMKLFGLYNDLSIIIGYDTVDHPKPAPDPLNFFCRHCELFSQEVLVIGDNVHDMQMAKTGKAGLKLGVLSGNSTLSHLDPYADYVLNNVLDLPEFLSSNKLV